MRYMRHAVTTSCTCSDAIAAFFLPVPTWAHELFPVHALDAPLFRRRYVPPWSGAFNSTLDAINPFTLPGLTARVAQLFEAPEGHRDSRSEPKCRGRRGMKLVSHG